MCSGRRRIAAVATARLDGRWLILDNRRMMMVEDLNLRNYRPLFVLDDSGVMKYVDTPVLAGMPGQMQTLAPMLNAEPGLIAVRN